MKPCPSGYNDGWTKYGLRQLGQWQPPLLVCIMAPVDIQPPACQRWAGQTETEEESKGCEDMKKKSTRIFWNIVRLQFQYFMKWHTVKAGEKIKAGSAVYFKNGKAYTITSDNPSSKE